MIEERRVRLLKDSDEETVHVPADFALSCDEVIVRKQGDCLVIEPVPRRDLLEILATLEPIDEDFGPIDDPPPEPFEL